jgi:hypothetical protein
VVATARKFQLIAPAQFAVLAMLLLPCQFEARHTLALPIGLNYRQL